MNKEKINKFGTLTEIMDDIVETDKHGNKHIKPGRIIPLIYDREFTYVLNKTNCIGS